MTIAILEWWTLVPNQSVIIKGGNTRGEVLNLGARSASGKWIIAYVADQPELTLDMTKLALGGSSARWVDPATGAQRIVGHFSMMSNRSFTRPEDLEDAVLVVTADGGRQKQ